MRGGTLNPLTIEVAPLVLPVGMLVLATVAGCQPVVDTNCTSLECVQLACRDYKGHLFCSSDVPGCNPAEEAISFMQGFRELGYPRNVMEGGLYGEASLVGWNVCEMAAFNFVYGDDPPDPDFDPCLIRGELEFDDCEIALAEWQAECDTDSSTNGSPDPMAVGLCSGGATRVLIRVVGFPFVRLYYNAESGRFLGYEETGDLLLFGCASVYWPMEINCPSAVVTEVICGDYFQVGDVLRQPWGVAKRAP